MIQSAGHKVKYHSLKEKDWKKAIRKSCDIIAIAGDPLRDITTLERVAFVMKAGAVVRDERAKADRKSVV